MQRVKRGVEVTFWGTRGSMAAPFSNRMKYGGNTSCVSVKWSGGLVIFDAGTGIRELGMKLVNEDQKEVHIFISHFHLDHIVGLPFFPLLFKHDCRIHLYVRDGCDCEFHKALEQISRPPFWPVSFEQASAEVIWHEIAAGNEILLSDGAVMHAMEADHPNGSFLYRFEADGTSVVYGLDCEVTEKISRGYERFVKDCSLLIFDGAYTKEEYQMLVGYGHGTWEQGSAIKERCNVGTLCISHHDWGRTDEELENMEYEMKKTISDAIFAREGMTIFL